MFVELIEMAENNRVLNERDRLFLTSKSKLWKQKKKDEKNEESPPRHVSLPPPPPDISSLSTPIPSRPNLKKNKKIYKPKPSRRSRRQRIQKSSVNSKRCTIKPKLKHQLAGQKETEKKVLVFQIVSQTLRNSTSMNMSETDHFLF